MSSKLDKQSAGLRDAAKQYAQAAAARDKAIRQAAKDGLSLRKIADAAGISHQRVHQIVHGR
jgi:predicted DNA-binding protein YlxM (UPF0122 family)